MWNIAKDIFEVEYEKFKRKNKKTIAAVAIGLFAAVVFLLGWMLARWPKGQWPRRK